MHRERGKDPEGVRALSLSLRARLPRAAIAALVVLSAPLSASAAPGDAQAQKGLLLAKKRDCAKAVPLLEEAEKLRHRPSTAVALADCHVAMGALIEASDIYSTVLSEKPARFWVRTDYNAQKAAKKKAQSLDARIPALRFQTLVPYEDLAIEVDGTAIDVREERRVAPDVAITIVARARGRKDRLEKVVLTEGERRIVVLRLDPAEDPDKNKPIGARPTSWLGARYYGVVIPKFVMNIVADGGRSLMVPGGGLTFTTQASDAELTVGLGYLSYRMGDTPFKPHGQPDTEWEMTSSTLQALVASVDLMWSFPLDSAGRVSFRIGGAAGVGWMFLGDLRRVQSHPRDGQPGDPWKYAKCAGPNNPFGSYRYCNALDKDVAHYPGYVEPDWFHGGIRPLVFPWLVLPQLGFSFRPAPSLIIDLDTGVSLSGIVTSLGFRVGL